MLPLKTVVKASTIQNLTDARYFAAWGAEWLGFNLDEGAPHYMAPNQVKEIKDWLVGPKIVGELSGQQTLEEIQKLHAVLELEALELGHFASLDLTKKVAGFCPNVIKKWVVGDLNSLEELIEQSIDFAAIGAFVLFDFSANGMDWDQLQNAPQFEAFKDFCHGQSVMLELSIPANAVDDFLATLPVYGLSLRGGEEEKVGYKSFDELDPIFEVLEVE